MLHARGQRHGVAAGIALHALGLAGGAAGVERVADVRGIDPLAIDHGVEVLLPQSSPQVITPGHQFHGDQLAVHQQDCRRLVT